MMKARQYDRRLLTRGIQPNIFAIRESNGIQAMTIEYFHKNDPKLKADIESIITEMRDAKEYGSILNITPVDFAGLYTRFAEIDNDINVMRKPALDELLPLVKCAELLAQKYDVVVTNPPYAAVSGLADDMSKFIKANYPDSKADLFAVFIERCGEMLVQDGYQAMITQHAWMFLSSFEKLRTKLLAVDIVNMAHLGARAFEEIGGEVVQTASFVIRKSHIADYKGEYCRLIEPTSQQGKEDMFLSGENRYAADQSNFSKIPGAPVAYWVSDKLASAFGEGQALDKIGASRSGMQTGDNNLFLRFWQEVCFNNIKFNTAPAEDLLSIEQRWFPHPKGGAYRKWYGNLEYVVNFKKNGEDLRNFTGTSIIKNPQFYFRKGVCWSHTTSKCFSGRFMPEGCIFNVESPTFYPSDESILEYVLGFSNTKILDRLFSTISQTMHYMAGDMAKIPVLNCTSMETKGLINVITTGCVEIAKNDWDSYETSWDFKRNPLV